MRLVDWFVGTAPLASKSVASNLKDLVYYQAGHEGPYGFVADFWSAIFGIFCGILIFTIIKGFQIAQGQIKIDKLETLITEMERTEIISDIEKSNLEKVRESISKDQKTKQKNKIRGKRLRGILVVISLFYIIVFAGTIAYIAIPFGMYQNFNRTVTQISPYIGNKEIQILRSKWVSMKSQEDYIEIYRYIDNVKEDNGL